MTNPIWPDPAALPFKMFGSAAPSTPPFAQGLAGGVDLIRKFWSLPGGSALPGFLVPTVDVGELDKRLSDLRAAESWLEVNLNMLRATIQGLEVQRNTIAAIHSLSAMAEGALAGKQSGAAAASSSPPSSGLPAGWPSQPPSMFAERSPTGSTPANPAPPLGSAAPAEAASASGASASASVDPVLDLAANSWLGFMQDQFMKVAQAAIAPSKPAGAGDGMASAAAHKPASKTSQRAPRVPGVKKGSRRRAPKS